MTKVLLVDDDTELTELLSTYLEKEGFEPTRVDSGERGVKEALSGRYDLAVLDVMMPGLSGTEALARIRAHSNLPVLMLTARGEEVDRVVGLEMGADDYVPKPCTPRELVARIRAILRRIQPHEEESQEGGDIEVGPLTIRPEARIAEFGQKPLHLTSTEFNLIELLARNAGHIVSKAELSEVGLGRTLARYDRSVDVHISSLRRKLGKRPDGRSWIQTIRGQGYQLSPL